MRPNTFQANQRWKPPTTPGLGTRPYRVRSESYEHMPVTPLGKYPAIKPRRKISKTGPSLDGHRDDACIAVLVCKFVVGVGGRDRGRGVWVRNSLRWWSNQLPSHRPDMRKLPVSMVRPRAPPPPGTTDSPGPRPEETASKTRDTAA
uniref:Uncharacterized protein n=1 Tax=Knipowitschia caucasica TaxID=637954 RepID=A0AAV2JJG6_KNICA